MYNDLQVTKTQTGNLISLFKKAKPILEKLKVFNV